jgi:hypothetical protein
MNSGEGRPEKKQAFFSCGAKVKNDVITVMNY